MPQVGFRSTVLELRRKNLKLCISDKEGGFVVSDLRTYQVKTNEAMEKNFRPVNLKKVKEAKRKALSILDREGLSSLCAKIKGTKNSELAVFFTAKTHKDCVPFRAIISERATWQINLSDFLAKQLKRLRLDDPYRIPNSLALTASLKEKSSQISYSFSIDIQEMYYAIPHRELMSVLRSTIEEDGAVSFQNSAGISTDTFLELLTVYLDSTVVAHNQKHYVQKSGICIGSKVAPYLSELYLASCDRKIDSIVRGYPGTTIFRYVDDFLISCSISAHEAAECNFVGRMLTLFQESMPEFTFTHELESATMGEETCTSKNIVVVPYVHGFTHNLKKIAAKQAVKVVCSAPNKAYKMCRQVNNEERRMRCAVNHQTRYADCDEGVIYHFPVACGKCYIGQTGRCINERAREHANSLRATATSGFLALHCRQPKHPCTANLDNISILGRKKDRLAREIIEAVTIHKKGKDCVSTPSIALSTKEKTFLHDVCPVP
ncbi:uncharacterized protein LOC144133723 [Amblyomma americanum]